MERELSGEAVTARAGAALLLAVLACAPAASEVGRVPVVGLPCEGCEAVFDGMPATLAAIARIAPQDEPGEPLVLEGIVRDAAGAPREGIVVYAYHTDAGGSYPWNPRAVFSRHGRLRGWARSEHPERRRLYGSLKALVLMPAYSLPELWRAIGYDGPARAR